jgi:hypothetical protein
MAEVLSSNLSGPIVSVLFFCLFKGLPWAILDIPTSPVDHAMDTEAIMSDSFEYAKEALVGKWERWAIFILLSLPFSLIQFLFDPKTISTGTKMNWEAVPWGQIALLAGTGFLLSFFLSGYVVRIYRGVKPAPDFTGWTELFIDGVRLAVVWLLWVLPLFVVLAAGALFAYVTFVSSSLSEPSNIAILLFILCLLFVEFILFIIVVLFGILGAVRFARTGSIREGIRFSAILTTIRAMGWLSYILALLVFVVVAVIYAIITGILSIVPFFGWVLVLIIAPFFSIFMARYFTLVYDRGEPQPVPPAPAE